MKAVGIPKPVWFGLYKWSITMAMVGECSKFIDNGDVERLRHAWDAAKGKNPYFDGIVEAGDRAFQDGDAAGNDRHAPGALECAVALRSLEASNGKALAELNTALEARRSK
jgi:hypothetical protein